MKCTNCDKEHNRRSKNGNKLRTCSDKCSEERKVAVKKILWDKVNSKRGNRSGNL